MKNKFLKVFALIFCVALLLTGCATLSDVKDENGNNISFGEPVYFQGQVARVGDYLYYGNAYSDISIDAFNYDNEKQSSYLARLDLSDYDFEEDVLDVNYKHSSPTGVEKVSDKLAGYTNQEMYAYGEYLYFTSANVHKTSNMLNDYSRVSLFRIRFNGTSLEELGTYTHDENSQITLVKGSDEQYHFVIVCPTDVEETDEDAPEKDATYDAFSIKIGDRLGKEKKLVSEAKTIALPDQNSTAKTVVYTTDPESERMATAIKSVDVATGDEVTTYDRATEKEISLIDRVGDIVLYTYEDEVYYKNVTANGTFVPTVAQLFYSASSISDVCQVGEGYVFKGTKEYVYKASLSAEATKVEGASSYKHLLFAEGDYIYLSSESAIARINIITGDTQTLASDMTIISGECGYDGQYIYFYAKRGKLEEVEEQPEDSKHYLYQADKNGNIQLLAQVEEA